MNLPTVKQLRYFVALDKYEHFGKAAGSCFVSQSAFSVAIRELESLLGVQLVDRTNKHVTITRVGKEIASQANLCLRDIEYLASFANSSQDPMTSRLTLGAIPTITPFILPAIVPELHNEYPSLQLYLYEDTTLSIYHKLMSGELDLLLIALPYKLAGVDVMPLFKDPFHVAYNKDTSILDPNNYDVETLPAESILLLEDGHCLRGHALSACNIKNQDSINRFAASSILTLIEMVSLDLGVSYLPSMSLDTPMLQRTNIQTQPAGNDSYREIGLVWRKNSSQVKEFTLLGEFIQSYMENKASS